MNENKQNLQPHLLIVDDDVLQRKIISNQFEKLNFNVENAGSVNEALAHLKNKEFEVVLLDLQMPDMSGLDFLPIIKRLEDAPEVVIITMDDSLSSGLAAMRFGAYDYLNKPVDLSRLEEIVKRASEKRKLTRHTASLRDVVGKNNFNHAETVPVKVSKQMQEIIEQAEQIARLDSIVLITGESGTGKDVLARHIHRHSARAQMPLISINCAALPESLFESEFFGYEKGAFTGANQTKRGLIEAADGSTLFLDEIGELSLAAQKKLLRFLEDRNFRRVGSVRDQYSDVRLIAATNVDLKKAVEENRFRLDLYYRLDVIHLHVAPLRERHKDVPALIDYFLEIYRDKFNKPQLLISDEARRKLEKYNFPGNIRELKNILERSIALSRNEKIEAEQIILQNSQVSTFNLSYNNEMAIHLNSTNSNDSFVKLEELERDYILAVLRHTNGNRERTASLLGISERTLYRRLSEYE